MEHIAPCQLQSYFAVMYNMCSINDIIDNTPTKGTKYDKFKQKLSFGENTKTITNYLPMIKAPNSCIWYWSNILELNDNLSVQSYKDYGYCSTKEIVADMNGYYEFYTEERFVILCHFTFISHSFYIILYLF